MKDFCSFKANFWMFDSTQVANLGLKCWAQLEMEFRDSPVIFNAKKIMRNGSFLLLFLAFFDFLHDFDHHYKCVMDRNGKCHQHS